MPSVVWAPCLRQHTEHYGPPQWFDLLSYHQVGCSNWCCDSYAYNWCIEDRTCFCQWWGRWRGRPKWEVESWDVRLALDHTLFGVEPLNENSRGEVGLIHQRLEGSLEVTKLVAESVDEKAEKSLS